VKTEEGEGRFDYPIVSSLTGKTGMMMLEKYIKIRSTTKDLSSLKADEPFSSAPEITPHTPISTTAGSDISDNIQDLPPITMNEVLANPAGPPGSVLGNNFVMPTFASYQTEGDPFQAAQDGSQNASLSQILAPREVLNTSFRLSNRSSIENAPNQIVPANTSAANVPGVSTGGVSLPPGTQLAPPVGVNLISQVANVSLVPDTNPVYEKIYNIDKWQEIVDALIRDDPTAKFSDYFDEWSYGTRLVYVAPTNDFEKVSDDSKPGEEAAHTLKIPNYPASSDQAFTDIQYLFDEKMVNASDAYMLFEREEVEEKLEEHKYKFYNQSDAFKPDGRVTIEEQDRNQQALHDMLNGSSISAEMDKLTVEMFPMKEDPFMEPAVFRSFFGPQFDSNVGRTFVERAVTVIPISSVEVPIELSDKDIRLSDLYGANGLSIDPSPPNTINDGTAFKDFDDLYTRRFMSKTFLLMKNSPGYSLVLKYCLSSDTLLTFSTIYSNLLNELPEGFFDNTKFELKSLFEILMNGGDYAFEGPSETEKGSNREQAARAQANAGTDGSARKPSLVDLATQTPKLIFKGLAEFIDPVIAPAALITKKAKAGEFFPGMMHEEEGNDKSPWYKLHIELNPYDLPPPLGAIEDPNLDIIYINEEESRRKPPDPAETEPPVLGAPGNIRMTTFVPNFIDSGTGESLSPFLRDYFFKFGQVGGNPDAPGTAQEQNAAFYMFSRALATYDFMTALRVSVGEYMKAMSDPVIKCKDFMIKKDGKVVMVSPKLDYPGPPIDIPVSALAMSLLPMDVMMGFGIWPPHSPLGWIYHAIEAADSLKFPTIEDKERLRERAGIENKKIPVNELCIDIDQMREESATATRENEAREKQTRQSASSAASRTGAGGRSVATGKKPDC
jgi:hypothetical protein